MEDQPAVTPVQSKAIARRAVQLLLTYAVMAAVMFGAAGTLGWARGWIYLGLSLGLVFVNLLLLLRVNPEAIVARATRGDNTKGFDKVFTWVYGLGSLGIYVLAALDAVRFGWAPLGWGWLVPGVVLLLAGAVPIAAAMAVNPFIEQTVRIQDDRAHQVVTVGPYALVRHPMYVGVILQHLALPLILGSAWSLPVALLLIAVLVVRTALEDRTLQAELPGYEEYSRRTRYRLLPGLW